MSEPSLSQTFKSIQAQVGRYLGYGRGDPVAWSDGQQADIAQYLQSGFNRFYHCGFPWSFLKPIRTLSLTSGSATVALDGDVGGVEGEVILTSPSNTTTWQSIPFMGPGKIHQSAAINSTQTGPPRMACIEPVSPTPVAGQRLQIRVYPTTDQAYSLQVQCYINPQMLDGSHPYAYGGAQHAETIVAACLAAAELGQDGIKGVREQHFQECLMASQKIDRRDRPLRLGQSYDPTAFGGEWRSRHGWSNNPATFAGVTPE